MSTRQIDIGAVVDVERSDGTTSSALTIVDIKDGMVVFAKGMRGRSRWQLPIDYVRKFGTVRATCMEIEDDTKTICNHRPR